MLPGNQTLPGTRFCTCLDSKLAEATEIKSQGERFGPWSPEQFWPSQSTDRVSTFPSVALGSFTVTGGCASPASTSPTQAEGPFESQCTLSSLRQGRLAPAGALSLLSGPGTMTGFVLMALFQQKSCLQKDLHHVTTLEAPLGVELTHLCSQSILHMQPRESHQDLLSLFLCLARTSLVSAGIQLLVYRSDCFCELWAICGFFFSSFPFLFLGIAILCL